MTIDEFREICIQHLREMDSLLTEEWKFTLLARHVNDNDCDIVITSDNLQLVEEAIFRFKEREASDDAHTRT